MIIFIRTGKLQGWRKDYSHALFKKELLRPAIGVRKKTKQNTEFIGGNNKSTRGPSTNMDIKETIFWMRLSR